MKNKIPFLSVFLCAIALCAPLRAAEAPKHLSVLAVGNSYDQDMSQQFPKWVEHSGKGHTLDLTLICMGGSSLEEHWQSVVELAGKAPAPHKKTKQQKMPLLLALNSRNWDYVTLHQVSWKSLYLDSYEPFLGDLVGQVKKYAPEAQIAFYQTWAYRPDHGFFQEKGITAQEMQNAIVESYRELSKRYGFPVIPVGEVFLRATTERPFEKDPNFDYANPPAGKLPAEKNSLHVGAMLDKNGKLKFDPSHAGIAGDYIIGGVWYAVLYGEDPIGNTWRPKGMSEEDALYYQKIISEVTEGRRLSAPSDKSKMAPKEKIDFSKAEAILKKLKETPAK